MNKAWECIIDVFIGILIIFVSVFVYFSLRTESVIRSMYDGITEEFAADIKRKGMLTLEDYENYMIRIGAGSSLFNISFEHGYKIYEPEYRFRTLEEIIDEQNKAYPGSNDYHYRDVITERPHVDDPINDGNLNTETNESILANAVNNPADPNHIHNENCYTGHKHVGSKTFIHNHAHTGACKEFISYITISSKCNSCGNNYFGGYVDYYWDSTYRDRVLNFSLLDGTKKCPNCGSGSISNASPVNYYQYSCGYNLVDGVVGSADKTPFNVVYQYERSSPQDTSEYFTRISGCYTYHSSKDMRDSFKYYDFTYSLNESSASSAFYNMHYNDYQGYCYIPRYIRIGMSSYSYYEKRALSSLPELFYVTYTPVRTSSGEVRFNFVNYMYLNNQEKAVIGYSNPGFPTNLTGAEFRNLYTSTLRNKIKEYFGSTYIDRVTSSTSHTQWFSGKYTSIPGMGTRLDDATEYVKVCDHNHSLGINRWITTCGLEEDYALGCDQMIISISPTHPKQTVYINDPIITTAVITYKNGATKTVLCTTDFITSTIGNDQLVTLKYGASSCIIEVNVIPRNNTCANGHLYNLNDDGSDPGCPYCKAWVESLRVIYPATSPIVITIGTTLQDNNLKLLVSYMDGHTEEIINGYIDNLDTAYLGTKPVTIGYKGASVTVMVTTVCATMICDICGYEYSLYPDGTNPGCPNCIQKIPVFTGNIMVYEHINHTEEILDILYKKRKYVLNVDDVLIIKVSNKSSTIARKFLRKIYPSLSDKWLDIERICNE